MITSAARDAFARRYRIQYEGFGEDRKQENVPDQEEMPRPVPVRKVRKGQKNTSDGFSKFEAYWANRLDQRNGCWTSMPGFVKYVNICCEEHLNNHILNCTTNFLPPPLLPSSL